MKHSIFWRDTESFEPGPALENDVDCDIAIIGGGYTSLWASHFFDAIPRAAGRAACRRRAEDLRWS